ncbi:hypothetical protein [Psychrobacter phenylpyruvicus]|uniref:Uncharacterized protein n=1 Tax=Psychrobacter phenylpyruvicus TaxID=29432 RepID=A0A379LK14_9GAMM|nr:Uncharacterised protein [Psychrobacter phenylpyruvicus]
MLAMSFNDATARLWELRNEIWQATIDTFVMLGISTTAAIIIGGLFGIFLFLTRVISSCCKIRVFMGF